jgi:hypothetical protein
MLSIFVPILLCQHNSESPGGKARSRKSFMLKFSFMIVCLLSLFSCSGIAINILLHFILCFGKQYSLSSTLTHDANICNAHRDENSSRLFLLALFFIFALQQSHSFYVCDVQWNGKSFIFLSELLLLLFSHGSASCFSLWCREWFPLGDNMREIKSVVLETSSDLHTWEREENFILVLLNAFCLKLRFVNESWGKF